MTRVRAPTSPVVWRPLRLLRPLRLPLAAVEYYKTCHGQRELVRRDWKLTGAATYEPGQYQFPFLLPLPPDMLPSLSADTMGRVTMSEGKRYR